jgi:hypothetical protein
MMFDKDSTTSGNIKTAEKRLLDGLRVFEIIFVIFMVPSIVGIGITDFSPARSLWYWYAMAPIFAGGCLIIEWSRVRTEEKSWLSILRAQMLTWAGLLVAVHVVFLLLHAGRLTFESTGLVILLLLALTTFIVGINLGYQVCLLGGFLGFTVLMVAYLEQYVWVLVLLATVGGSLSFYGLRRKSRP